MYRLVDVKCFQIFVVRWTAIFENMLKGFLLKLAFLFVKYPQTDMQQILLIFTWQYAPYSTSDHNIMKRDILNSISNIFDEIYIYYLWAQFLLKLNVLDEWVPCTTLAYRKFVLDTHILYCQSGWVCWPHERHIVNVTACARIFSIFKSNMYSKIVFIPKITG